MKENFLGKSGFQILEPANPQWVSVVNLPYTEKTCAQEQDEL